MLHCGIGQDAADNPLATLKAADRHTKVAKYPKLRKREGASRLCRNQGGVARISEKDVIYEHQPGPRTVRCGCFNDISRSRGSCLVRARDGAGRPPLLETALHGPGRGECEGKG